MHRRFLRRITARPRHLHLVSLSEVRQWIFRPKYGKSSILSRPCRTSSRGLIPFRYSSRWRSIGYFARSRVWGKLLLVLALAALIHIATDLPVHADDAYRHFWPLSDWRFYSPLSYWDNNHHAFWVSKVDIALALGSVAVLWKRHPTRWVKIALSLTLVFYAFFLVSSFR